MAATTYYGIPNTHYILIMIASLTGTIARMTDRFVVVDVGGVGYAVHVPTTILDTLSVGSEVTFHIHTSVTETDIVLYGFTEPDACTFFELLISVSGIGARSAIAILSQPYEEIRTALVEGDIGRLTKLPGIGQKTAERMVMELREKVSSGAAVSVSVAKIHPEAMEALASLGFQRHEALTMLSNIPADVQKTEDIVQYALKL